MHFVLTNWKEGHRSPVPIFFDFNDIKIVKNNMFFTIWMKNAVTFAVQCTMLYSCVFTRAKRWPNRFFGCSCFSSPRPGTLTETDSTCPMNNPIFIFSLSQIKNILKSSSGVFIRTHRLVITEDEVKAGRYTNQLVRHRKQVRQADLRTRKKTG